VGARVVAIGTLVGEGQLPGLADQPAAGQHQPAGGSGVGEHLDLHAAGPAQPVELALAGEGPGQGRGAVTHVGRLLVALGRRQGGHAGLEWLEEDRRVSREAVDEALDDRGVLGLGHGSGARAGGDPQLRGCARPGDGCPGHLRRAAPDGQGGLDGVGDQPGRGRGAEGTEVEAGVARPRRPDHRQAGERLVERDLQVGVAAPDLRAAVEGWLVAVDEAHLEHGGLEGAGADDVVDRHGLPQELGDLSAVVAAEVRPHSRPQVGGLAHVQHPAGAAPEEVDPGPAGQAGGELQLAHLGMGPDGGQLEEVVEAEHAQAAGPLEQEVEEVAGGQGVGQGPVGGPVRQPQPLGKGAELAVRDLVADQAPGQGARVDPPIAQRRPPGPDEGGLQEPQIEAHVVAHDHGRADELEERRQHGVDLRSREHHGLGDAGQHGDLRRYPDARVHQRLERAQALAAPQLHRAHLGDLGIRRGRAGGLQVEHAERHLMEGDAQVVEAALHRAAR
jgi:hypothetical protein